MATLCGVGVSAFSGSCAIRHRIQSNHHEIQ
ncbi:hypothetical protein SY91_06158 [Burkholderia cenocepacia]|nr:hypothetical protein SY91_06158 [Burkholderia cenocepacia]